MGEHAYMMAAAAESVAGGKEIETYSEGYQIELISFRISAIISQKKTIFCR